MPRKGSDTYRPASHSEAVYLFSTYHLSVPCPPPPTTIFLFTLSHIQFLSCPFSPLQGSPANEPDVSLERPSFPLVA